MWVHTPSARILSELYPDTLGARVLTHARAPCALPPTHRLSELYPDTLVLGMEIRDKVSAYVRERIGGFMGSSMSTSGSIKTVLLHRVVIHTPYGNTYTVRSSQDVHMRYEQTAEVAAIAHGVLSSALSVPSTCACCASSVWLRGVSCDERGKVSAYVRGGWRPAGGLAGPPLVGPGHSALALHVGACVERGCVWPLAVERADVQRGQGTSTGGRGEGWGAVRR